MARMPEEEKFEVLEQTIAHEKEEKKVEEDIEVADNLRARRRRQNRNRRQRRRNNNRRRNLNQRLNQGNRNRMNRTNASQSFLDALPKSVTTWCQAVTHPFGPDAVGALRPDEYAERVTPTTDRLNLTFDPAPFQNQQIPVQGVLFAFVPRCISAGWWKRTDEPAPSLFSDFQHNIYKLDPTLTATTRTPFLYDAYEMMVCVLSIPASGNSGCYGMAPLTAGPTPVFNGANTVGYTRYSNIQGSCTGLRIVGAGIKAWSNAAPINAGGRATVGTMVIEDLYSTITGIGATQTAETIETLVKHRIIVPASKGGTSRYDPLQSAVQLARKRTTLDAQNYRYTLNQGTGVQAIDTSNQIPETQDLAGPEDEVPVIIWRYENAQNLYTLQFRSIVHGECEPSGDSPFLDHVLSPYPGIEYVMKILKNPKAFPLSATGHSFKDFFQQVLRHGDKVVKTANDIMKVMRFASTLM